jgi:hypothetical protein
MAFFVYAMTCINTTKNKNDKTRNQYKYKGCFFFKFGVEESIVNEPLLLKTLIFQTAD